MIQLPVTYSPDSVDEAEALGRLLIDVQLNNVRLFAKNINTTNPSGLCLWCDDEIGHDRRWCDSSCRDDWQKFDKMSE